MRILYFSRDYSTHDHRFLSALTQTEHQIYYLRLEQRGHTLEDRALPFAVEQVQWAGGRAPVSWRDGLRFLLDLKRVLRNVRPDLIMAGPLQRSAFLVALAGFRPLISMSWGYDLLFDARRNSLWAWATRFTLRRSAAMVGDCDTIRRIAIEFGMQPDRVVIFPWGADIEHFRPSNVEKPLSNLRGRLGLSADAFLLLSTRGWESIYGVDVLAQAFARVACQNQDFRLIMLGNGSLAPQIRKIFMQAGVEDQVYFPGQVGHADLPHYYQAADLYISTSHSDGTSISLLEALACGCPVLLSDIPGNREWLTTPGKEGWLFTDSDVNALANAMTHAYQSRHVLPQMGQAARLLAELRADWRKNFPNLFKAFEIATKADHPIEVTE